MSTRQRRRPMIRKPSAEPVGLGQVTAASVEASTEVEDPNAEFAVEQQRLLEEFEAALSQQSSLDREDRDFIFEQYKAAIENASLESEFTSGLDRQTWIETVELLSRDQSAGQADVDALIRQFDEVMKPLQSAQMQVALEYLQRLQQHGEADAMSWLQEQNRKQEQDVVSDAVRPTLSDLVPRRQSITQSKSRRLRGPPKG